MLIKKDLDKVNRLDSCIYLLKLNKRTFFSLIEISITLIILSVASVLTLSAVREFYKEQQFLLEVKQFVNKLEIAQDLMLLMDGDVHVILQKNPSTQCLECKLECEQPLKQSLRKFLNKPLTFSAIRSFTFEGNIEQSLDLNFTLGRMSKGTLLLCAEPTLSTNTHKVRRIDFLGYPTPWKIIHYNNFLSPTFAENIEALYPL